MLARIEDVAIPPFANLGITGMDNGLAFQKLVNGFTPKISTLRILLSSPLIALKGTATTLLMPPMIPFTTVVKTLLIPLLIPSKILPPVEKTFLTAAQALLKVFLNQEPTEPKASLIPCHKPEKKPGMPFHTSFIQFQALTKNWPISHS